jgi:hypothetical protein
MQCCCCLSLLLLQEYCDLGTLGAVSKAQWAPDSEGDEQMLQRLLLLQDCARGLQVSECHLHQQQTAALVMTHNAAVAAAPAAAAVA